MLLLRHLSLGAPTIQRLGHGQRLGRATGSTNGFTMVAGAAERAGLHHDGLGRPDGSAPPPASASFAVQVQDQFGNPVTNTGTAVTLDALDQYFDGDLDFFTPTHSAATAAAVTIANGCLDARRNFYYSDTKAGVADDHLGWSHFQDHPGRHGDHDQRLHHGGGQCQQAGLHLDGLGQPDGQLLGQRRPCWAQYRSRTSSATR